MSRFRLLSLGVGDAFSARHYSACFALQAEGRWLLIDCPHPVRKVLRDSSTRAGTPIDLADLDAVVLTHLHGDHASGLEIAGFFSRFVLQRPLPLITHPAAAADLWDHCLAAGMRHSLQPGGAPPVVRKLEDFFAVRLLCEGEPLTVGPFTLHSRPTQHTLPTIALRVEAAGRTLGYSADTAFDPGLIEWLSSADLIIHEANGGFMHTPYEDLAALPAELRRKMRLIHCADSFDAQASLIELLEEGRVYTI